MKKRKTEAERERERKNLIVLNVWFMLTLCLSPSVQSALFFSLLTIRCCVVQSSVLISYKRIKLFALLLARLVFVSCFHCEQCGIVHESECEKRESTDSVCEHWLCAVTLAFHSDVSIWQPSYTCVQITTTIAIRVFRCEWARPHAHTCTSRMHTHTHRPNEACCQNFQFTIPCSGSFSLSLCYCFKLNWIKTTQRWFDSFLKCAAFKCATICWCDCVCVVCCDQCFHCE